MIQWRIDGREQITVARRGVNTGLQDNRVSYQHHKDYHIILICNNKLSYPRELGRVSQHLKSPDLFHSSDIDQYTRYIIIASIDFSIR